MKNSLLLFLFVYCFWKPIYPQDFLSNNYNGKSYKAHNLIWDAETDSYGRIWFANNNGLLRFDGNNWVLFNTPNPVRNIAFSDNGELYIACEGDFGEMQFKTNGSFEYVSLKKQLALQNQNTGGNEQVYIVGDEIYFSMANQLVRVQKINKEYVTDIYKIKNILGACSDGKQLFINSARFGFSLFNNGKLEVIVGGEQLAGNQIVGSYYEKQKQIIATAYDGIFVVEKNKITRINGNVMQFAQNGIASIARMHNGDLVIGTLHHGVRIFKLYSDKESGYIEKYTLNLPSPEVYSLHVDEENNIWVAHNKGLSHVLTGLPIQQFRNLEFPGYATDMQMVGRNLYIASSSGLYKLDIDYPVSLTPVMGIGECWDLFYNKGLLLIAGTNGLFQVNGNTSKLLIPNEVFLHIQKGNLSGSVYVLGVNGCYKLLNNYASSGGKISVKLNGVSETATSILEWRNQIPWVGTYHNGLIQSAQKNKLPPELLNGKVVIRLYNGQACFQAKNAVYRFDGNNFTENSGLNEIFQGAENNEFEFGNNFWIHTDNTLKKILNNKVVLQSPAYCISGKPTALFESHKNLWVAFENEIYCVESDFMPVRKLKAHVNKLTYGHLKTGFSGFFVDKNGDLSTTEVIIPEIKYDENSLHIEFGMNSFINPSKNRYSYKIEGLNKDWSEWQSESFIDLKGLSGGEYTFRLKAHNASGQLSEESVFNFKIIPPFYLSGVAYMVYGCIFILLVYALIVLNNKRLIAKNVQLEIIVNERTKELKEEKQKSEDLLHNILPVEVANELKQKGNAQARHYNNVTVMFTDFVNFTGISEQLSPADLVHEIHKNFTAFDAIIEKHGLEKIKTIGDAYLAVCGLPNENRFHAIHTLNAAQEILAFVNQQKEVGGLFKIRIGINSGPVVAGIVGAKKFAYDIWGDTVNTAARMEQNSESGKINISGSTFELVKDEFTCLYRGKIDAKNKGMVDMYFVNQDINPN